MSVLYPDIFLSFCLLCCANSYCTIMMQSLVNLQASPHAMLAWTVKSIKQWANLRGKILEDQQFHATMSKRANNLGTLGGLGSLVCKDWFHMSREIE